MTMSFEIRTFSSDRTIASSTEDTSLNRTFNAGKVHPIALTIQELGRIAEIEKERKLTPSENLQKKLYAACLDGTNRVLGVCRRIAELVWNGLYNTKFTEMDEINLRYYYETHGYLTNGISLTGFNLTDPEVIFTNPKSQAYCVQSLYRDMLIPQPRPKHDYPQNDLWQLLKFRLEADTYFCTMHFPDYFKPSDISYRMGKLLTGNPLVHNVPNPGYESFMQIFNTLAELTKTYVNMSLVTAGREIINTHVYNISMNNSTNALIQRNLANISRVHLFMALEPVRLGWADELRDIPTLEKLWAVARTSLCEIRYLMDVLKKITPAKYSTLMYENDASFDLLGENDLRTLDFLMANTRNITGAINMFSTCPYEIPVFDEDLQRTFIGDQMLIQEDTHVSMHLASYRDSVKSLLTIAKRSVSPAGNVENLIIYTPHPDVPRINLVEAVSLAINQSGNLRFMLTCKTAELLLDANSRYKINLGRIERPKIRTILEHRTQKFINTILSKNFEDDISSLFTDQQATLPVNAYDFFLQSGNLDPILHLSFYDSCIRLSPFSPLFQPTSEFDYIVSFGYDVAVIHDHIFQQCTLQNAVALLYAFNVTFAVKFSGTSNNLLDRCQRLALDSGRSEFHDLLANYLPDGMHHIEDQFEDRVGPPPLLPLLALTFSMSLFFILYMMGCLSKKSQPLATAQPLRREGSRRSHSHDKDDKPVAITVIGTETHSHRLFSAKSKIPTISDERRALLGSAPDGKRFSLARPIDRRSASSDETRRLLRK